MKNKILDQFLSKEDKLKNFLSKTFPLMIESDKNTWFRAICCENPDEQKLAIKSYQNITGVKLWEEFDFLPNIDKYPPKHGW